MAYISSFRPLKIGVALFVAIGAAVLYFAPLYLDGLAQYWEILLFIVGLILLALEVFVIPASEWLALQE